MDIKELTSEKLDRASKMLKAIAHPIRLQIVAMLDGGDKLTVTEIHKALKIEQSVASHHLNILREKGALDSQRTGRNTFYFLKHEKLNTVIECIRECA